MRIAHVVPTYPPYRGGVGRLAAEYATRLRARGHDVQVFTPRYEPQPVDDDFVHRLGAPLRVGNAAFTPSLLTRLRGFDIVHLHYPFFGGAEPVLLRKWLHPRQPLVLSYHMDAVAGGVRGALFRLHARLVLPRIVSCADRVLVSSADYAAHSALTRLSRELTSVDRALGAGGAGWGIPARRAGASPVGVPVAPRTGGETRRQDPGSTQVSVGLGEVLSRVEVHPYGVDTERFRPGRELALRARVGSAPKDVLALFVSRLDPAHHFKGLQVLLNALAGVRPHPWRLLVVGDGSLRHGFERQAAALDIADRVHFAGDVSEADLPAYYRAADVHVCPSTAAAEAFSLVTLEAAASGVPTIASALPGVRTVVVDGETGAHVPPNDAASLRRALDSLMERPAHMADLGRAARARVEAQYQWDTAILRLEQTYREVLSAAG